MNQESFKITEQKTVITIQTTDFYELQSLVKHVKNNGWTIETPSKYVVGKNLWEIVISKPVTISVKLFEER